MRQITMVTLSAAGMLLATATIAQAQFRSSGRAPREGACFYKDANYRGASFCAEVGDDLDTLPSGANDELSSIRVYGGAEVVIYKNTRFRGESRTITRDVSNLQREGMNDEVSSIRVNGRSYSGGRGRPSFGGDNQNVERVIRRAYQDLLDREPDAVGLREYRRKMIDEDWSEARVRDAIRDSREYREKSTMTPAKAQEIVARAYQNVLRREPDAGSRNYVQKVLRDKWSQQDVERELRKSDEYRNRPR